MQFYSAKNKHITTDFAQALMTGLAPDGGLYMPEAFPEFNLEGLESQSFSEIAFMIAKFFVGGQIPDEDLKRICEEAYDFPVPFEKVGDDLVLELFHGPTGAFKDFAARFMARCVEYFLVQKNQQKTLLVATSGDTGGAVGYSFRGMKNMKVFILYPSGGVSPLQEKQLTTMGGNVQALEVEGDFDACQALVKQAFLDESFNQEINLMSANSINIGRILPQSFYYFWSSLQLKAQYPAKKIVYSIPSGNLGNVTGALMAKRMGAPIDRLIISQNKNHPFVDFLQTGHLDPHVSHPTISNAMDIGNPSNFHRIVELYKDDLDLLRQHAWGSYFADDQTRETMQHVCEKHKYTLCPHTAVGYLGLQKYKQEVDADILGVCVSTAHPGKFQELMIETLGSKVALPENLQSVLTQDKIARLIKSDLDSLKNAILT